MISHRCGHRGCNKYIDINIRYCDEHAKLHVWKQTEEQKKQAYKHYNKFKRDKDANDFYHSSQWYKVRSFVVNRDMYADQVTGDATGLQTLVVDHIIALKYCTQKQRLDPLNLWVLNKSTHTIKTNIEKKIASKPNGSNILRHLSKEWWTKILKEKIDENKPDGNK